MPQKPTLLHVAADYAANGLEFSEIMTRFHSFLEQPDQIQVHFTATPSLDTIAIGFVTAQLALASSPKRMVIYGNAAPRRDKTTAKKANVGQGIKYAKLKNGVEVINVYSEYAFGFMKSEIVELREIDCPNRGSQFRSRDFFPEKVAEIVNGDYSSLKQEIPLSQIPAIPSNLVAWTDGFGNIKTSMRASHLTEQGFAQGEKVQVILNGVSMLGVIATGGFTVDRGVLAVNAGSSGFTDPYVELFLRVHHMHEKTAAVRFDFPPGGSQFELKKLTK